jgi:hypothetical protein
MPNLIVTVDHSLSQDEALRRIQVTVEQVRTQYLDKIDDLQQTWNGYVGTFQVSVRGYQIPGTVIVNSSDVTVQTTLPFIATFMQSTIEGALRNELAKILE